MKMNFLEEIEKNNATHTVDDTELNLLISEANKVYKKNFDNKVWFERSIFINWSCAIADCKYCFLSTRPKNDKNAVRSQASILAEIIICNIMGWKVGYLTGGLRVESDEELIDLMKKVNIVLGEKIMMNFGPYSEKQILKFKPHISGMGSAIESFDEELHNFICPSKPLKSLMQTLEVCKKESLQKIITIILGMGEKKNDVNTVIEKISEFGIEKIQLCFLKPQENTVFENVPSPDPKYMAWWISKIRIAHPKIQIKVALVDDRIQGLSLMLNAGANSFSRFMIYKDFAGNVASSIKKECEQAGRELLGSFFEVPAIDINFLVDGLPFEPELKGRVLAKVLQYYDKLKKLNEKNSVLILK